MLQGSPAYKRRAGILKVCQKHAGGKTYVKSMSKACQKYVKSVTKVCQKYAGACYTLHAGARRQATPAYYACNACILCLQRLHTMPATPAYYNARRHTFEIPRFACF
jgi:hypothetical protein